MKNKKYLIDKTSCLHLIDKTSNFSKRNIKIAVRCLAAEP